MDAKALCIRRIDQVREIAMCPELAYAARTRLQRTVLECSRFVAKQAGMAPPVYPDRFELFNGATMAQTRICRSINALIDQSRLVGQPSEPLEDRWKHYWSGLLRTLDELEKGLIEV